MLRSKVIERVRYLRKVEFQCIFLLPVVLAMVLFNFRVEAWQPFACAMGLVCVILAEGSLYWHLKLKQLEHGQAFPAWFGTVYRIFKWLNVALLLVYPALAVWASPYFQISIWSNLLFLFAILEHINYFYYQLSHDNREDIQYLLQHRKLRRSPLYTDLKTFAGR